MREIWKKGLVWITDLDDHGEIAGGFQFRGEESVCRGDESLEIGRLGGEESPEKVPHGLGSPKSCPSDTNQGFHFSVLRLSCSV